MESFKLPERKESSRKEILNALELSAEQEKKLIDNIINNNGIIRIFILPEDSMDG